MKIGKVINQKGMFENGVKIEITPQTLNQYNNERFWTKVAIKAEYNLCWEWLAAKGDKYGNFKLNGKGIPASRASYILTFGEIEKGLIVCHKCDNPICVNPNHLFLGTYSDNQQDMIIKGREKRAYGVKSGTSKLSEKDIIDIKRLRNDGVKVSDISKKYPVNVRQIFRILSGERWSFKTERKPKTEDLRKRKGERNPVSKLVLDTETGIFYYSVKEAAEAKNYKKNTLSYNLNKKNNNKTSFVFA